MNSCKLLFSLILWLSGIFVIPGAYASTSDLVLPDIVGKTFTGDLPEMQGRKIIRALVSYGRTDFFFHQGHARGIQADILHEYEKHLNKGISKEQHKTRIVFVPVQFNQLIPALLSGKGDIAAAFLTITPEREKKLAFASGRVSLVNELVITHKSAPALTSVEDLAGKAVYVLSQSSYQEHLQALNRKFVKSGLAPINIRQADDHLKSEDILELVNSGVVDITVVDDYRARLWAQVLPEIRLHDNIHIGEGNHLGWAIRPQNTKLAESLNGFVDEVQKGTLLGNMLMNRYFKETRWIKNPLDGKEREKLKQFIRLFRKYGEQYQFDYLAIMAQAYQESGLDHGRKSQRGAVGVMQLLPSTAATPNVGIKDIHSIENNIHAGAKYLAFLRDRYFSDPAITAENKFAFSWAAYNAGPSKVRKMRRLAAEMGLDRNKWFSNVELAAGRITGPETVRYVANIYKYYIAYKLSSDLLVDGDVF